jgi:hypothetical protein
MTPSVSKTLNFLSDPETEILISLHQPNLFAYGGIFKKIVFLETLKDNISKCIVNKKIVNLFVIVDHDFMDETWMRLAQLPSPMNASGILELRMPMYNSKRWTLSAMAEQLGIGTGWYEEEYLSYGYGYGYRYPSSIIRLEQLDECLAIINYSIIYHTSINHFLLNFLFSP